MNLFDFAFGALWKNCDNAGYAILWRSFL